MSISSSKNKIGLAITKLIQSEIKAKGLVDTGTLLNSISTKVDFDSNGELEISVSGEDYFKFLDKENNIIKDAFNSPAFKKIEEEIGELYVEFLEEKIK